MKQLLILIAVSLWATFATYQWIAASSKTDSLIEAALLEANLKAQSAATEQAEKARQLEATKTEEIKIVYKTIKDVVYKNRVISQCTGEFPVELRLGLSNATAAANGDVLTAQH